MCAPPSSTASSAGRCARVCPFKRLKGQPRGLLGGGQCETLRNAGNGGIQCGGVETGGTSHDRAGRIRAGLDKQRWPSLSVAAENMEILPASRCSRNEKRGDIAHERPAKLQGGGP